MSKISANHYDVTADKFLATEETETCLFLNEVSNSNGAKFCVPYWQRDYDWGTELIHSFITDLKHVKDSSKSKFRLGTIVLGVLKSETLKDYANRYLIIDGQQRFRTLNNLCIELGNDSNIYIPLYYGLGERECLLNREKKNERGSKDQLGVFNREAGKLIEPNASPVDVIKEIFEKILVHVIVVTYEPDPKNGIQDDTEYSDSVENHFNLAMSSLFQRINLQAKRLNDIDYLKSQIIIKLREFSTSKEVDCFSKSWEIARAIVMTNSNCLETNNQKDQLGINEFLNLTINDSEKFKLFEKYIARDMDDETLNLQFSRYLLLVLALLKEDFSILSKGEKEKVALSREDGLLKKRFTDYLLAGKDQITIKDNIQKFCDKLDEVNKVFLKWRPYLLVRRSQLDRNSELIDNDCDVQKLRWKLLRLQCFIDGGTSSYRSWLESEHLFLLLQSIIDKGVHAYDNADDLNEIIGKLEKELFKNLVDFDESKANLVLTARDWLIWRVLFDKDASEFDELFDYALGKFANEPKISDLRKNIKSSDSLPSTTGASQIEHWVAKVDNKSVYCDELANKAHIAFGINQSLRDKRIQEKAMRIEEAWWPTLQFMAVITRSQPDATIVAMQSDDDIGTTNITEYLEQFKRFWQSISEQIKPYVSKDDSK